MWHTCHSLDYVFIVLHDEMLCTGHEDLAMSCHFYFQEYFLPGFVLEIKDERGKKWENREKKKYKL